MNEEDQGGLHQSSSWASFSGCLVIGGKDVFLFPWRRVCGHTEPPRLTTRHSSSDQVALTCPTCHCRWLVLA